MSIHAIYIYALHTILININNYNKRVSLLFVHIFPKKCKNMKINNIIVEHVRCCTFNFPEIHYI